jgi:glycosyltransferase involved in cell wall biosynthesis
MKQRPKSKPPSTDRLRILFLANAEAVHARRWVRYFREQGHDARWLSLERVPNGIEAVKLPERFILKAGSILLSISRIKAEIKKFQPHVVNALFIPNYGWAGALAGFQPLAVAAWGSDVLISPQKSFLHRRRISWTLKKADLLFSDAQVITDRMVELGAERKKIVTEPLGVDPGLLEFTPVPAEPADLCTVVTNRRFDPIYRNDTFAEAAIRFWQPPYRGAKFLLIGDGPQQGMIQERVRQAGITSAISFRPFLPADELYRTLTGANIYVSCSESDGTSVSLLEAMALGLYPIVTDIPANREWIADGDNGRLFPVGDAEALAKIISEVSEARRTWPEVREKNRAIIRGRALWPNNMAVVEKALIKLVN